ncbi:MAG: hypothetical protein R3338_03615 [Thermoanaerobaculia bacterium]|nr:hypothetical protein [Thermoanaerobaculia bacterium]
MPLRGLEPIYSRRRRRQNEAPGSRGGRSVLAGDRIRTEIPVELLEERIVEIGPSRFLFGSEYPMRDGFSYIDEIEEHLKLDPGVLESIVGRDIFNAD